MGDAFITRRGGGGGKLFATIAVTYPSGSVCTCSNGAKTLKAKGIVIGNIEKYTFAIPAVGEWVIQSYDGLDYDSSENKSSQVVAITEQYQNENVELFYYYTLFEVGKTSFETFKSNCKTNGSVTITEETGFFKFAGSGASARECTYTIPVDVTKYNNLVIYGYANAITSGSDTFGLSTSSQGSYAVNASMPKPEQEKTIDISKLQGNYYFRNSIYVYSGANHKHYFKYVRFM